MATCFSEVQSLNCLFYYIEQGSLLDAILFYNTGPLFIPLLAALIYKEKISHSIIISTVIGFIGIVPVLHPTKQGLSYSALIGLASGFFMAYSQICFHRTSHNEKLNYNMFSVYARSSCFALIMLLIMKPHSIASVTHFNVVMLLALLGMAFAGLDNQTFRHLTYKATNHPARLALFIYFAVIISELIDWFLFHDVPSLLNCVGALLVLISAFMPKTKRGDHHEPQTCLSRH